MSYLVTGGAGFIGSHLTEALLERGDRVVVLDDMSTGRMANLHAVFRHPNLRVIPGSILDELMVDELVHECDVVVHLAAAVGVKLIIDHPLRSLTTNLKGSEIVVEAAHRYRRRILVASTSEVYGKNGNEPLRELSDRILGPTSVARWWYSMAKAMDEILALSYHRERGLPVTVVRFFNTVGPRQSPQYGMVIPRLVRQAVAGEPVTVYGDGTQSRCFCHVSDVVRAVIGLLEDPGTNGEIFNIGSTEEISIGDLAQRIVTRAQSSSPIVHVAYDDAYGDGFEDMRRRFPDTTKVRDLIGWTPHYTLDDVLDHALTEAITEHHDELEIDLTTSNTPRRSRTPV
jgi:UDP-glucose 4-epimerase